jgi:ABC-type phosphate transport system substrate-binding protein
VRRGHRIGFAGLAITLGFAAGALKADVVAVVSASSPVTSLSKSDVLDIFLGKRTRFPDGSSALPIDQSEGTPARQEFYSRLAAMSPAQLKGYWSKVIFTGRGQPPMDVSTGLGAKKAVVANPNAIGYIDQSLVDSSVRVVLVP